MAYDKKTGRTFDPSDPDQVAWNNSPNRGGDSRGPGGIKYPGKGWQERHPDHHDEGASGQDRESYTDNFLQQAEVAEQISSEVHAALKTLEEAGMVTVIGDSVIFNVSPPPNYDADDGNKDGQTVIFGNHTNRLGPIIEQYRGFFKCESDHVALEMVLADIRSLAFDQALSFNTLLTHANAKFRERQRHAPS